MGIISGCPVGAKIATNFRNNNICSKEECERLLSFTNNSGPLFIIGTVGISMFKSFKIGLLLFITHLLASISVGFIFRFWKYKTTTFSKSINISTQSNNKNVTLYNLGEIMSQSIYNSITTIVMIGGFIVIFSSIISILNSCGFTNMIVFILSPFFDFFNIDTNFIKGIFTGLLEITSGINLVAQIPSNTLNLNIILSSIILGFGGISIMLQVLSIVSKTDLSIKPYIFGKLLQGILSGVYTYIFRFFLALILLLWYNKAVRSMFETF